MTTNPVPNRHPFPESGSDSALSTMRPRFISELVFVPSGEGTIVDGAHRLQILQGKSNQAVMQSLLPLMDGKKTLQELGRVLPGVAPEQVYAAALLLMDCGIIEDCSGDGVLSGSPNLETLAFFRRYLGTTAMNRSGSEAYEKLQKAQIAIIEDPKDSRAAHILVNLLKKTGVARVGPLGRAELEHWQPEPAVPGGHTLLVSMATQREDEDWNYRLDEWCSCNDLPWLRVVIDEALNHADIGPLFNGREGPCYRCFQDLHGIVPLSPPSRSSHGFIVNVVAVELIYLLTQLGPLLTGPEFRRYQLEPWRTSRLRCARIPGCPRCLPMSENSDHKPSSDEPLRRTNTALIFEDYVRASSRIRIVAKARAAHPSTVDPTTFESKRLQNCASVSLTREIPKFDQGILDALNNHSIAPEGPITLSQLSILLLLTAGIREIKPGGDQVSTVKRWAPTSGNLGSVEVYVAARSIDGLRPGLYLFQPEAHSLALFQQRHQGIGIDEFMKRAIIADSSSLPDALLIFTGAFHRIARKYDAFGYRLLNFDAGVAASQAHLIAGCLGIVPRTATRWADDLIEWELNLQSLREQVTIIIGLSGRSGAGRPISRFEDKESCGSEVANHLTPARSFCNLDMDDIVARLYKESRIQEDELHVQTSQFRPGSLETPGSSKTCVPLPPSPFGGRLVGDVLGFRRSVRRFIAEPVTLQQIGCLLAAAREGDIKDWPEEHQAGQNLQFVVLARTVKDIAPAAYTYRAADHALSFLAPLATVAQSRELFVNEEFAEAPVVIWILGDLAAASARHGAFGHRQLLLRAGAAGHRAWMAAAGTGLAGCLVGGLRTSEGRKQFGFDGYRQASLLAVAVGFASRFFQGPVPTRRSRSL